MRDKYRIITFRILFLIPLFSALFLIDQWVLPQREIKDVIVAYNEISVKQGNRYSKRKEIIGTKFFTKKGYEFSVSREFIEEDVVKICSSYIFRSISSVKSEKRDYSENLMSGINGACYYFSVGLVLTSIITLLMLKFDRKLSENGFQNIILINSFLLFVTLYVFYIHN